MIVELPLYRPLEAVRVTPTLGVFVETEAAFLTVGLTLVAGGSGTTGR